MRFTHVVSISMHNRHDSGHTADIRDRPESPLGQNQRLGTPGKGEAVVPSGETNGLATTKGGAVDQPTLQASPSASECFGANTRVVERRALTVFEAAVKLWSHRRTLDSSRPTRHRRMSGNGTMPSLTTISPDHGEAVTKGLEA